MKKAMSIAAIALMMAGSVAYACGGCGCQDKKKDGKKCGKEKTECSKGEESKTACGGAKSAKKAEDARKAA